jgi:membrane associated rhomboid family serine protease
MSPSGAVKDNLRAMIDVAAEIRVRGTPDGAQARDWSVVLAAAGIGCRVDARPGGWVVVVSASDASSAAEALDAYDAELGAHQPEDEPIEWGPTTAGMLVALSLFAFQWLTGYRANMRPAFRAGEAFAGAIQLGEWWRVVTALTLHADTMHLLGNVVGMGVLGTAVCRMLGPGLGMLLVLVAGAGGNLLNSVLRDTAHVSVGASTAIFGAVGILVGLAILRARSPRRRPWVPLAAGLALLGFLGTGEHADLAAHFFGFQVGIGLGMGTAVMTDRPPSARVQRWLAVAAIAIVVVAWALALRHLPTR